MYRFGCTSVFVFTDSITGENKMSFYPYLFFCYKNRDITVVYSYIKDYDNIISCPLSEFNGKKYHKND
jgi:hypothetical protein